jgi:hypothetical protein
VAFWSFFLFLFLSEIFWGGRRETKAGGEGGRFLAQGNFSRVFAT